jgi:thiamine biosynthesis lipoprotein
MGSLNTVVVENANDLAPAMAMVEAQIREIDRVCSRFKEDSELSRLNHGGGGEVTISPLLEEAILAALHSAEMTNGLVDPTVGRLVEEAGYTVTFRDLPLDGPPVQLCVRGELGWRALVHDPHAHTLRLPQGMRLDLGASGKAWAADRAAAAVVDNLGVSVAVECGGDVAVGGAHPRGGWPIRVAADIVADEFEDVVIFDGGLATSGTTARRWRRGGIDFHHIIDPTTGLPALTPWAMVSVAAATCLEANAAATAALIMGDAGPAWLDELHLPGRLVDSTGGVHFAGGWSG